MWRSFISTKFAVCFLFKCSFLTLEKQLSCFLESYLLDSLHAPAYVLVLAGWAKGVSV